MLMMNEIFGNIYICAAFIAGAVAYWVVFHILFRWLNRRRERVGTAVIIDGEKFYRIVKSVEYNEYLDRKVLVVDGPCKNLHQGERRIPYRPRAWSRP